MSGNHESAAAYAALYAPTVDDLRRSLPDIGDGLQAQFQTLFDHLSAADAEQLASNLSGASRTCLRLAEAIRREGAAGGHGG
jgi:hypothetical protein